jgi:hypothetical protein
MLPQRVRCHSDFLGPPNSGPGGRRFKSSLPDQLFSTSYSSDTTSKTDHMVLHQEL